MRRPVVESGRRLGMVERLKLEVWAGPWLHMRAEVGLIRKPIYREVRRWTWDPHLAWQQALVDLVGEAMGVGE